jgi:hypothetical protein
MDFSIELTNAEKRTAATNALNGLEPAVYEAALNIGIEPVDLADDYTAPGSDADWPLENRLADLVARIAAVKAHLAALPA